MPHYIKQLQAEFEKVPMGQVSGLAPKSNGSPFDNCLIGGNWSAEQFALHGGPIPCQGGAPGSRGIPESWPHAWVGRTAAQHAGSFEGSQETEWANMNWQETEWANMNWYSDQPTRGGRCADSLVPAVTPTDAYGGCLSGAFSPKHLQHFRNWTWWHATGSLRRNSDGSKRVGGKKLNKNKTRGGNKRKQCNEEKPKRDKQLLKVYFGNTTYASEKAKAYLVERDDDIVMIAETHLRKEDTLKLIKFFGQHKWQASASPARLTEKKRHHCWGSGCGKELY